MLREVQTTDSGIMVKQPDGSIIRSTHVGILDVPTIGETVAHIFPSLVGSLISISVLVDLGLTATYSSKHVCIYQGEREILRGDRDPSTGLWMLDLSKFTKSHTASLAIQVRTQSEVAAFWHGTFGSPALTTLIKAMDKGFITLPGVSAALMRKHAPNPVATSLGHLDQTRQGLRSTRPPPTEDIDDPTEYNHEPKRHIIVKFSRTGRNYMDMAGRFPHQSARGANYMMIMYSHDTGYIHIETPASRSAADIVSCFERGIEIFSVGNDKPTIERIDNECSKDFRAICKKLTITIELAAPGMHRTNAAERAIRTFKNHFIATLSTADKNFPLELWDELVPQAEITLNLMRTCRSNPAISAFEAVRGPFDINKTPIAPAGTRVVVHVKPLIRASWDAHGVEGFYVGPALEHYRCYRCWIISTAAIRITDTVAWHPERLQMPGTSLLDVLTAAISDLSEALHQIANNPTVATQHQPIDALAKSISQQLKDLGAMFQPREQPSRDIEYMFQSDPLPITAPAPPEATPAITAPAPALSQISDGSNASESSSVAPLVVITTAVTPQRVVSPHPTVPPGFQPITVVPVTTTITAPKQRVQTSTTTIKRVKKQWQLPKSTDMKASETIPTTTRGVRSATRHRHKDYEAISDKATSKLPQAIQRSTLMNTTLRCTVQYPPWYETFAQEKCIFRLGITCNFHLPQHCQVITNILAQNMQHETSLGE